MREGLSALDWGAVAVFLAAVLLFGLRAAGRQRSTRDYFLGDRSLPAWAVALSIIATETSAVTYYGTPGQAYGGDWSYLQMVLGFLAARVFLALFFIRAYYRAEVVTVYGFLRERFGERARLVAALLFLLGRVIASGVRLYAAAWAVQVAGGLGGGSGATFGVIACLGLLGLAYTLLGGIRSVVWTECVLGATFLLGGLAAAVCIFGRLPGGLEAARALPGFGEKLRVFHGAPAPGLSWLADTNLFWIGFGGGFVLNLATHGTDQDMVQRMLTCSDWRRGSLSLVASGLLILPLNVVFLAVGSLLYFYHRLAPAAAGAGAANADEHLLRFIGREMPAGVAGLVLAGLAAAAVSSHTSVLNALAATTIADFYRPHVRRGASEAHYLAASRLCVLLWGVALVLVAAAFLGNEEGILKTALSALTYFYGALLGVFLVGILTRRGSGKSAVAGMLVSVPVVLLLQLREFLERDAGAPSAVRAALAALPAGARESVRAWVPLLAWPLWVAVGTAVSFAIASLAPGKREGPPAEGTKDPARPPTARAPP